MPWALLIGAVPSGLVLLAALISLVWVPHDVTALDISSRLQGASGAHWLGTDQFGRDILSMLMVGAQTSIAVALIAVGIGIGLGVPL
ncbi:MAG: ABC transporter permease, partial [Pseudomonadota bacterium]